jgi:hypothetical protein
VATAAGLTLGAGPAAANDVKPTITLVHGIPGVLVDIYVNGAKPIEDVAFETVATVPGRSGHNTVDIRPADAPAKSSPLLHRDLILKEHQSKSVVAHLTAAGKPKLTVFPNDQTPLGNGKARVTVRHVAAAPAVDIVVDNSTVLVAGLSNPHQAKADVPAGSYLVDVRAAGTTTTVLDDASVHLAAGTNTIIYAIGSLSGGTFTVVTQVLDVRPF